MARRLKAVKAGKMSANDTRNLIMKQVRESRRGLLLDLLRRKPMSKREIDDKIMKLGAVWATSTLDAVLRFLREEGVIEFTDRKWRIVVREVDIREVMREALWFSDL